jgi:AcrR family transcriptional regulator
MGVNIHIQLNENLYIRDPQDTRLGKQIIQASIYLIDEIGFEDFTFKKLAIRINSTEASIYRYFENKHRLLVYLLCWYWEWMKYLIEVNTTNITDPSKKLEIAISTIVDAALRQEAIDWVDEDVLHRIVVAEAAKAYHTKQVDEQNKQGFFLTYKALNKKISELILEINPQFMYPKALASSLLEMANDQIHFARHLPSLTDIRVAQDDYAQVKKLLYTFVFNVLDNNKDNGSRASES